MDWHSIQPFFDWLTNHAVLAGLFVFLIAFTESLFIVGLIVPGTVLMFGVGTLVGAGALDMWHTFFIAFLGAVAGDGVSFYIGKHYHEIVLKIWPFNKHPDYIEKGKQFFTKHGGKSILIGRFVGPVRPVIPAVAGMMGMSQSYFFIVNIVSAIGWAPFYLVPGIVFGSSISLAAAVGSRLVILFLLVFFVILVTSWLLKGLYVSVLPWFQRKFVVWYEVSASKKYFQVLFDDEAILKHGAALLFSLSVLLVLFLVAFISNVEVMGLSDVDLVTTRIALYLQSEVADRLFLFINILFSWPLISLLFVNLFALLLYYKQEEHVVRLIAGVLFSLITVLFIYFLQLLWGLDIQLHVDAFLTVVGLTSFAFIVLKLIDQEVKLPIKVFIISLFLLVILFVLVNFLYLQQLQLSSLLLILSINAFWMMLLLWGGKEEFFSGFKPVFISSSFLLIFMFSAMSGKYLEPAKMESKVLSENVENVSEKDWQFSQWQSFEEKQVGLLGENDIRLNMQWLGSQQHIFEFLISSGWEVAAPLKLKNALVWLNPKVTLKGLGEIPESHNGKPANYTFYRYLDSDSNTRLTLRLWKQEKIKIKGLNVWLASLVQERLTEPGFLLASVEMKQNDEMLEHFASNVSSIWYTHIVYDKNTDSENDQRLLLKEPD